MITLGILLVIMQVLAAVADFNDNKPFWAIADLVFTPLGVYRFFYLWVVT